MADKSSVNQGGKLLMGAVIISVVLTAFVNSPDLNLTGLVKTFATIGSWIPTAVALIKLTSQM